MNNFVLLGFVSILPGCASIYLASPNQRWLSKALPKWPARALGAVLLVIGWLALMKGMLLVAASFVFVIALMLTFVLLPYIGALISAQKGQ